MDGLSIIVGIGIVSFMIIYFSTSIDESHRWMKLLSMFFGLALLILIPFSLLNVQTNCDVVVDNATLVNANLTHYDYVSFCHTQEIDSISTFYKVTTWFYRIFIAYVVVYLMVFSLKALWDSVKRRGR